jgi:hypothetical protein
MLNIISQIREACYEFEGTTGKRPISIYLGRNEWTELHMSTSILSYLSVSCPTDTQLDGKNIYLVAGDSHLAVA